ncbi:MAG TPA: ferritin-like domain-containing protein [Thermoanaerobaculia bacterium]|jgi:hypothetical protein|nr:ferritin-like domain-containing protein [Thermoanaerobaculia bacterium]
MKPEITTRADLIDALRTASELEHQLMVEYLFAVYSMRRYTWEGLDPVQLEWVRRWSSSITLIARQEMEHLGLALNLLSSIGGTPSFTRPNMPQRADYYGKAGIKLELTRGNLDTIKRFQRFEAPDRLTKKLRPEEPVSQSAARKWCHDKDKQTKSRTQLDSMMTQKADRSRAVAAKALTMGAPMLGFGWASVQELYEAIRSGFDYLASTMGERNLFVGKPSLQIFGGPGSPEQGSMDDLNQYEVDLIGVTGLASAQMAITMILEQGEGISVNASYLRWTHFCLFTGIRNDMEALKLGELAARPCVRNPMTVLYPDVEQSQVTPLTNPHTLQVSKIFNQSYELMLLMLLYLYSDNVKTQTEVNSFMDAAFFPLMTMFVRPLAEILTELPAFRNPRETSPDGMTNAGPGFELNGDVLLFPTLAATWDLFQERIDTIVVMYEELLRDGDPWIDLPNQRESGFERSRIWRRLEYMRSNMQRLASDWRARWLNIGITTQ